MNAIAAQQFSEPLIEGLSGPGDESSPGVFELVPDDLDQIEFRAVGWQIDEQRGVIRKPTVEHFLRDIVMYPGIIEHDEGQLTGGGLSNYRVQEVDHDLPVDIASMGREMQSLRTEVERPEDGTLAVSGRFSLMHSITHNFSCPYESMSCRRRASEPMSKRDSYESMDY